MNSPNPGLPDRWSVVTGPSSRRVELVAPGIHCGGCVSRIERGLMEVPDVTAARVNLSTKRIAVEWTGDALTSDDLIETTRQIGFDARPFDPELSGRSARDRTGRLLLRSMAVAGFAAANIMLLSVSVWSGAEGATRSMFHWVSALIALPAIAYSGRPFFQSAVKALRARVLNMDVPISLAVILAAGMSLVETIVGAEHAYFDAAVMLLFFLLVGRFLDHMMRDRAHLAVTQLLALSATGATVVDDGGSRRSVAVSELAPGMRVFVAAGERVPVDGCIDDGASDLDRSMVTGESIPEPVAPGDEVHAGAVNLTGPLTVTVLAAGEDTFLAEIVRLMEGAERTKGRYVRLADRAARFYAPAVHILAALSFGGWFLATGAWHPSLTIAVSVLIITCPCALGLAVPVVQIVASGMLFRRGVLVKDGAALEKLAAVDTVVFDKTGTLTLGAPIMADPVAIPTDDLAIAAGLARSSTHPLSRALTKAVTERGIDAAAIEEIREVPGNGLEGTFNGNPVRLGRAAWCGTEGDAGDSPSLFLRVGARPPALFTFQDALRGDAGDTVAALGRRGIDAHILSGDAEGPVGQVACAIGIARYRAAQTPQDKLAFVDMLRTEGRKVLMVGDGINDAPALAAGHVSMAPSTASDVGRTAADMVFTGDGIGAVVEALDVARTSQRLIRQNFALALLYNAVAVPIAVAGFVTPLIAAIAMSSSSILVTLNALRLRVLASAPDGGSDTAMRRPGAAEATRKAA